MSDKYAEKIEAVEKTDNMQETSQVEEPDKAQFDALMNEGQDLVPDKAMQEQNAGKPGLMEEMERAHNKDKKAEKAEKTQKVEATEKSEKAEGKDKVKESAEAKSAEDIESIQRKEQRLLKDVGGIKEKAAQIEKTLSKSQDKQIGSSYQKLLDNKLTHIDDNIKITMSKAGAEHKPPAEVSNKNPLTKFLNYFSNVQDNMDNLAASLEKAAALGEGMKPEMLLAFQIKTHRVQQEIEFFSNLLNKALESAKTIMNVQI